MIALVNRPSASITDAEVSAWLKGVKDGRVHILEAAGRDQCGRPMIRLEAEGLEPGTYSIGRAIAMLTGTDKAKPRVELAEPHVVPRRPSAFERKTSARQMTDAELEWIEDMDGGHPHVSWSQAVAEQERRDR